MHQHYFCRCSSPRIDLFISSSKLFTDYWTRVLDTIVNMRGKRYMTTTFQSLISINVKQLRQVHVIEEDEKIVAPGSPNLDAGCDRTHQWKKREREIISKSCLTTIITTCMHTRTFVTNHSSFIEPRCILCIFRFFISMLYIGSPHWRGLPTLHPLNIRVVAQIAQQGHVPTAICKMG